MGVSMPGGGGKHGLDFEINLIPFIDLLSCLISFLLITAVWSQLGRVDVTSQGKSSNEGPDTPPEPLPMVLVDKDGYYISMPTETGPRRIARNADTTYKALDLKEAMRQVRTVDPNMTKVQVSATDDVPYKEVVKVFDVARGEGLLEISPTQPKMLQAMLGPELGAAGQPGAPPTPPGP